MKKTSLRSVKTESQKSALELADLQRYANDWVHDCEYRQHSKQTLAIRRFLIQKLTWFLQKHSHAECGTTQIRAFIIYCSNGHEEPGGRWGNPRMKRPVRPRTVETYYGHLRTFFDWLVTEGVLDVSPMQSLRPPMVRRDQIQPFQLEEVQRLLNAAHKSIQPRRDEAILWLLFDTGMRASELCSLKRQDIDFGSHHCTVLGKGNKFRRVPFGRTAAQSLYSKGAMSKIVGL